MLAVMTNTCFWKPLLEECIVSAVNTLLARKNYTKATSDYALLTITPSRHPESLLRCAVRCLLEHLQQVLREEEEEEEEEGEEEEKEVEEGLPRALVWWLVVREQLPIEVPLSEEEKKTVVTFSKLLLQVCVGWQNGKKRRRSKAYLVDIQSALDCCTVVSVCLCSSSFSLLCTCTSVPTVTHYHSSCTALNLLLWLQSSGWVWSLDV